MTTGSLVSRQRRCACRLVKLQALVYLRHPSVRKAMLGVCRLATSTPCTSLQPSFVKYSVYKSTAVLRQVLRVQVYSRPSPPFPFCPFPLRHVAVSEWASPTCVGEGEGMSDGLTSRPTPFVCREPLKRFVLQGLPVRVLFLLGFSRHSHLA